MDKPEFDDALQEVRELYESAHHPALLAVALDYKQSQCAFKGNATDLRHLLKSALMILMPDARRWSGECPCDRCRRTSRGSRGRSPS
jgi:hypothetical protein